MQMTFTNKATLLLAVLFMSVLNLSAQQQSKLDIALRHVEQQREAWGLERSDIADMIVSDAYQSEHNGVTHHYFLQRYMGIEVVNAITGVHVQANGNVAFATNRFIGGLAAKANATSPQLSAHEVVQRVAAAAGITILHPLRTLSQEGNRSFVFEKGLMARSDIKVKLVYEYLYKTNEVRLAWQVWLEQIDTPDYWNMRVDALNGQILAKDNFTVYCKLHGEAGHSHADECSDEEEVPVHHSFKTVRQALLDRQLNGAGYHVFPVPVESPIHGDRELVFDPHDTTASPYGWHDTNGQPGAEFQITRGNNVWAYLDDQDSNSSAGNEPNGGPELLFDFPFDDSMEPDTYQDAAVTQLFYMNNMLHDITYRYGFTEAAGNFQQNNYGNGGAGSDAVRAEAQDGGGTNNANFATPPDGSPGRMQMYLWTRAGGRLLNVLSPAGIAGGYLTGTATFGPQISNVPVTGQVVAALDDTNSPNLGCETIVNADEVNGKIALVDRGSCFFIQKATRAQEAGAIALIICNFEDGLVNMGPGAGFSDPTIPTVMLTSSSCQLLRQVLSQGVTVSLVLPADSGPNEVDGDFDNGIIAHELGHGISNRLTGGPSQAGCLGNNEQMGEGWSDYFALITSVKPGDTGDMPRGIGNYAIRAGVAGSGIRRLPYSTNPNINRQNYDDIIGTTAPHPLGEVWAGVTWDLYWAMAEAHGFDPDVQNGTGGNNMAIQLVMDGMKLQACSPGFIDGRDAILTADFLNNEGANQCLIWEVFARRGFGHEASQGSSQDRNDGRMSFDVLPECIKELKIAKASTQTINAGDEITITLVVTNHQDEDLTNVVVNDEVPNGTSFVTGSAAGGVPILTPGMVSFEVGSLAAGATKTIIYRLSTSTDFKSARLFYDDMESGDGNWDFNNINGIAIWELVQSPQNANSGQNVWFVPNVAEENDQLLQTLNPITVTGTQPVLRFFHKYNTQAGVDGGLVYISKDGGTNWELIPDLLFKNGYRGRLAYGTFATPNLFAYWGNSNGYVDTYVDLSAYQGEEILVRFRFGSDAEGAVDGWYMDDFEVLDMFNYNGEACVSATGAETACAVADFRGTIVESDGTVNTNDETAFAAGINIYPNPAKDILNVGFDAAQAGMLSIEMVGVDGRVLQRQQQQMAQGAQLVPVNVSMLAPGFYFVRISTANGVTTKKIVIQ